MSEIDALLEAGLKAYGNNDADTAVRCWRRVLELQPTNAQAKDFLITAGFELVGAREPSAVDDGDARGELRARVELLVKERKLEQALGELDRARARFPDDPSISRSIRLLRDRLVVEYGKILGKLDDVPCLAISRDEISRARPSSEELALLKLIDGIASLGDIVRGSQLGRFETYRAFVRFVEQRWVKMRAPTGTWNPREFLGAERFEAMRKSDGHREGALPQLESTPRPVRPVEAPPSPEPSPALSAQSARSAEFEQCIEDGLSALLRRRYDDAFKAFARAAQLDASDRTVQANLLRLKQLGYGNEGKK
ncbi:MAG: hypothetical protein U0269_20440 [Polyangiales bacterium]